MTNVLDRFRLDGRVAIVTGSSAGLGVAFAYALAEAGATLVLGARRLSRLQETKNGVEARNQKSLIVQLDVADPAQCTNAVTEAMAAFRTGRHTHKQRRNWNSHARPQGIP
jgi:NADP-dependent 3-hydroxy acid dehydrogenase YdfG